MGGMGVGEGPDNYIGEDDRHVFGQHFTKTFASARMPGERIGDGTIFAGISPDTGKPMYTTPTDAPLTMRWKAAMQYAAKLDAHGHKDWRVPTRNELNVLFQNRASIGGFDVSGSIPRGWYWSSKESCINYALDQRFSDGGRVWEDTSKDSSLRCVRG